jgi:hypothetical protein
MLEVPTVDELSTLPVSAAITSQWPVSNVACGQDFGNDPSERAHD